MITCPRVISSPLTLATTVSASGPESAIAVVDTAEPEPDEAAGGVAVAVGVVGGEAATASARRRRPAPEPHRDAPPPGPVKRAGFFITLQCHPVGMREAHSHERDPYVRSFAAIFSGSPLLKRAKARRGDDS